MQNPLMNLSNPIKGIFLIIAGSGLVLNYLEFIQSLKPIIALIGVAMIVIGILMANLHNKVYGMIKKDKNNSQDQNQDLQPPQGW